MLKKITAFCPEILQWPSHPDTFILWRGKKRLTMLFVDVVVVCCRLSAPDGSALLQNTGSELLCSRANEDGLFFCSVLCWKKYEGKRFYIIPQPPWLSPGEKRNWFNLFSVVDERVKITKILMEFKEIKSLHCDRYERFEPFSFVCTC